MNTNTFALSSSSPSVGQKRYGGMDGGCRLKRTTAPSAKKMAAKNLKFHEQPLLYLSTRLLAIIQRAFQKGMIPVERKTRRGSEAQSVANNHWLGTCM